MARLGEPNRAALFRQAAGALLGLSVAALLALAWIFYTSSTQRIPASGGTLTYGIFGSLPISGRFHPLLGAGAESDIVSLIFGSLVRFDVQSGEFTPSLGSWEVSDNAKTYTFTIHKSAKWHDGTPVTAADAVFTFQDVIGHPDFPDTPISLAFSGVVVEALGDQRVRFTLPRARESFLSFLRAPLLPRHLLEGLPLADISSLRFGPELVGSGPYQFASLVPHPNFVEVRLRAFPHFSDSAGNGAPFIDTISLRYFSRLSDLLASLPELDVIRPIRDDVLRAIPLPERFSATPLLLPQYTAVFFRFSESLLATKQVRQAMRAALNTSQLAEDFLAQRVDTPLAAMWPQDDIVNISPDRAAELMEEAGYFFVDEWPEDAPPITFGQSDIFLSPSQNRRFVTGQTDITIEGRAPRGTNNIAVNGTALGFFSSSSRIFSYRVGTDLGTLNPGRNAFRFDFFSENDPETPLHTEVFTVIFLPSEAAQQAVAQQEEQRTEAAEQYRMNADGQHIKLRLIHQGSPQLFPRLAKEIADQWKPLGVEVIPEERELAEAIPLRDYDLILVGQNVGIGSDVYPYLHLSQAGGRLNLSDWKDLEASVLMVDLRRTLDEDTRQKELARLRDIIIDEVPGVFLFSPQYTLLFDAGRVQQFDVSQVSTLSDVVLGIPPAHTATAAAFESGKSWLSFPSFFWHNATDFFLNTDESAMERDFNGSSEGSGPAR